MNESSHGQHQSSFSNDNQNDSGNLITLLQDPEKYIRNFEETYQKGANFVKLQKFSQASQHFLKCCQMVQIGKNIFNKVNKYWPVCVYINLAFVYQNDWKIQKTNRYLEKAQEIITGMMQEVSRQRKEQFLHLSLRLVKLKYQQCAVLSQLNQHEKALSVCESALPLLRQDMQIILEHAKKQYSLSQQQENEYGVKFGVKVYSFAQEVLNNLLSKMKISSQASKPSTLKKQSSMQFYYWQKNPERNQKQLRNSFVPTTQKQQTAKRSILGVTKEKTWIDQFNIGYLMKMGPSSLEEWQKAIPLEEYLFKQKIYEYIIYASVGYFTMATQMRLIDTGKKGIKKQSQITSKHQEIKRKYGYQQKSQQFTLSESHHLTAISIVTENIQTLIPYLSHIIKSYDKHYIFKKKLDQIMAIPEESVLEGSKISGIRVNSITGKESLLTISIEKQKIQNYSKSKSFDEEDYGYSYHSKSHKKQHKSSSGSQSESNERSKQKITSKSQKKTFNNIQQTYAGVDNSLRNKTTQKMIVIEKLSQTLKHKVKRKNFSQESLNEFKNSLESIEKKPNKKLSKSKLMRKKIKQNEKVKQKEKEKEKEKNRDKDKEKLHSVRESKKAKILKNNLKEKISLAGYEGEGELQVKHKSCTSFKFVFKKKS